MRAGTAVAVRAATPGAVLSPGRAARSSWSPAWRLLTSWRSLAVALAAMVSVWCGLAPAVAAAQSPFAAADGGPRLGAEIESMRTETSETFARSDGAYVTRVHQRPVYRKVGNAFEKIDAGLVSAGGALSPRAAGAPVRLPLQAGGAGRVGDDRYWIELSLQGASGAASTSGSTATYASALPSVSRVLDAQVDGVKESLILDSKAAQSEYRYSVDLAPGLALTARADGGLRVADAEGVTRFSIAPPVVWDANGGPDRPLAKASYRLEGSTLVLSVDRAWLDAAARTGRAQLLLRASGRAVRRR